MPKTLFFDLETIPDLKAAASIGRLPPEPKERTPADQMVSPSALVGLAVADIKKQIGDAVPEDEWLAEAMEREANGKKRKSVLELYQKLGNSEASHEEDLAKFYKDCATCPELCRVVATGTKEGEEDTVALTAQDYSEAELIEHTWKAVDRNQAWCGYNIHSFDFPVLVARALMLGVDIPKFIDLQAYTVPGIVDLYRLRFGKFKGGGNHPGKLKEIAALYGCVIDSEESGASVIDLVKNSKWEDLARYVTSDVKILPQLLNKWRGGFVN